MGKKTREEDGFIKCIVFGNADLVSLVSVHAEFKPEAHHKGGAFPIAVT